MKDEVIAWLSIVAIFALGTFCVVAVTPIQAKAETDLLAYNAQAKLFPKVKDIDLAQDKEAQAAIAADESQSEESSDDIPEGALDTGIPGVKYNGEYWLSVASHAYGSQSAMDAGGIVEYEPGFYGSHNYDEGQTFLSFDIGDTVHIDGYDVTIEGYFYVDYAVDDMESIRARAGYDTVCFQTCTGNGSEMIVYYGHVPGAHFDAVADNGSLAGSSDPDDVYNAEAYALKQEKATLDAEYEAISADWDAAYESGDVNAIADVNSRMRDYESRINDYNARVDDHNARF